MGDHSAIQWTDATWNPVLGCTRVSAGCDHCYAAQLAATRLKHTRQHQGLAVVTPSGRAAFNGTIRLLPERLNQPLHWRKPRRIFVNSLSDLFHEGVPDDYVRRVFDVMAQARHHTFQVLTKRPQRMAELVPLFAAQHTAADGSGWPLPNVQLGVSTEDQATADERIPLLLETPAAVRFVSAEPLLAPVGVEKHIKRQPCPACRVTAEDPFVAAVMLAQMCERCGGTGWRRRLDWVIVGGESGPGARPMHVEWARAIVRQCHAAGVPVFVKQLGAVPVINEAAWDALDDVPLLSARHRNRLLPGTVPLAQGDAKGGDPAWWPEDLRVREFPR